MTVMTESKAGCPQPGLDAAREGRSFWLRVYAKTGIDSETVLTDSTLLKPVSIGKRLVITRFYMNLGTVSDWVTAELVATANDDGSGEVKVLSPKFRVGSGVAGSGTLPNAMSLDPPVIIRRSDGHAFTARVQGNDAAAALTLGLIGWEEADTGAN